jgi:hypothetical protein
MIFEACPFEKYGTAGPPPVQWRAPLQAAKRRLHR